MTLGLTLAATQSYSTSEIIIARKRHSHGRCVAMSVAYLTRITEQEQVCDEIEILISGDRAAFHASYRTADGDRQRTFVRAPQISVIPPKQPHAIHCQRQSEMIVISLDPAFFAEKAREELGSEAPRVVERYAAVDPFMREVGNTLRSEFRMQRIPSAAYLESLAAVIAIHLAKNYGGGHSALHPYRGLSPRKLNRVQTFIWGTNLLRHNFRDDARPEARSAFRRRCRSRGYATFCILLAKSRPEVGGGRGFPSL